MPRRKIRWWTYLVPPPTKQFLRSSEGELLLTLLTDWWIRREELLGIEPRIRRNRFRDMRYEQAACYRMLQAQHYPTLNDRDELALDAVHGAFERWTRTRKASKLAQRSYEQIRYELARAQRSAGDTTDLELGDLDQQLMQEMASHIYRDVAQLVGQDVHQAVHHAVHQDVHQSVHAAVHAAVQDAASHADGGHADGGGHH